jgi:hypothetical protein
LDNNKLAKREKPNCDLSKSQLLCYSSNVIEKPQPLLPQAESEEARESLVLRVRKLETSLLWQRQRVIQIKILYCNLEPFINVQDITVQFCEQCWYWCVICVFCTANFVSESNSSGTKMVKLGRNVKGFALYNNLGD